MGRCEKHKEFNSKMEVISGDFHNASGVLSAWEIKVSIVV